MRRQKRLKKIDFRLIPKDLRERIVKKAVVLAVALLFLALAVFLASSFLYGSDYFKLSAVEARDAATGQVLNSPLANEILKSVRGKNLFAVSIKNLARMAQAAYPDAKNIVAKRVLPDKVVIDITFRRPVALIKDWRYYPVDEECYIMPSMDPSLLKKMPVISGISIGFLEKEGRKIDSKNLKLALSLLSEIKRSRFARDYAIASIDASDAANLSFYLANGLEIRIGCEQFRERLNKLRKVLKDPRLATDRIKYIDLRFEGASIAPK